VLLPPPQRVAVVLTIMALTVVKRGRKEKVARSQELLYSSPRERMRKRLDYHNFNTTDD
jgi:hypothetical protein